VSVYVRVILNSNPISNSYILSWNLQKNYFYFFYYPFFYLQEGQYFNYVRIEKGFVVLLLINF